MANHNQPEVLLEKAESRGRTVVRTSILGIAANAALAALKVVMGTISGSIAITMDAVNNLSDAASSLITILGTLLAGRQPDKKHPFGYGRVEYLSAMVISILVLYAGLTSLVESVKAIFHPTAPSYNTLVLVLVAVGVVVKILLGLYVKSTGKRVNSDSLVASGTDALMDSIISGSTLVAAGIFLITGLSLEAWLGAIISLLIIKSGFEMLRDTISEILGERAEVSLIQDIKATVKSFPDVTGAYDLVLHNYGPDAYQGSVHIELPDTYSAEDIDDLLRRITMAVYEAHHVILTAIGVYSVNTKDDAAKAVEAAVKALVLSHDHILGIHGFYLSRSRKAIRFDMVVSFDAPDRRALFQQVRDEVADTYPDYTIEAAMDADYSEL